MGLSKDEKATNYDTLRHIERVRNLLNICIVELLRRSELHDQSKLEHPEVAAFTQYTPQLAKSTYGSPEYQQFLEAMKPTLQHHYANNRHHPEFTRQDEEWLPTNFDPAYEISNHGDIRSTDRIITRSTGDFFKQGQILSQYLTPKGYCRVQLQTDGKKLNTFVHVLVAEAFVPNPDNKPYVNHKDGDKTNNYYQNLEWVTASENLQHAYDTDLKKATIKYVVTCEELGLITFGCDEMEAELRSRGFNKARASRIWQCINHGGKHLDLSFVGTKFEQWMNSPLNRMNLIDVMEMLCDWKAASERHNDGNIRKSIEVNANRFGLSPQLVKILENTADILFAAH